MTQDEHDRWVANLAVLRQEIEARNQASTDHHTHADALARFLRSGASGYVMLDVVAGRVMRVECVEVRGDGRDGS